MKTNLYLFCALVVLISGTYFFHEKRQHHNFELSKTQNLVISETISTLKTNAFDIKLVNDQWFFGSHLVSFNDVSRIIKILKSIRSVKEVGEETEVKGLEFEVNGAKYILGNLNLEKNAFYFKSPTKSFLAVIDTDSAQVHSHDDNIHQIKLDELYHLLNKSAEELKEKQLFRYYPKLTYESVLIKPDGALEFELDFKTNSTLPLPIKGIEVHENIADKFKGLVTAIHIKNQVEVTENILNNKIGEIVFYPSELKWEVYVPFDDKADVYLVDSNGKGYEVIGGSLRIFFIQIQDYWDKKIIPPHEFKSFDALKLSFYQGPDELKVTMKNREPLEFESDKKLNLEKLNLMIQLLFNLSQFDQGQRVSNLTTSQMRQILSEDNLRVEIMGQELAIVSYGQEIIVANITQEYKVHFLKIENFPLNIKDMVE